MQEKIVIFMQKMYLKGTHFYIYCFLYAVDIGAKLWQFDGFHLMIQMIHGKFVYVDLCVSIHKSKLLFYSRTL